MTSAAGRLSVILLGLALTSLVAGPASSQAPAGGHGAKARDMELVGHDDLQGRSAYQPTIHKQGERGIAYVGERRRDKGLVDGTSILSERRKDKGGVGDRTPLIGVGRRVAEWYGHRCLSFAKSRPPGK